MRFLTASLILISLPPTSLSTRESLSSTSRTTERRHLLSHRAWRRKSSAQSRILLPTSPTTSPSTVQPMRIISRLRSVSQTLAIRSPTSSAWFLRSQVTSSSPRIWARC
ncbi:hypothetical protein B0H19DRAFT_1183233 [Mycena capillaripes]|nr:hypothetical protein B0H19DRAFT_1183233 [Mycena capillaripes]